MHATALMCNGSGTNSARPQACPQLKQRTTSVTVQMTRAVNAAAGSMGNDLHIASLRCQTRNIHSFMGRARQTCIPVTLADMHPRHAVRTCLKSTTKQALSHTSLKAGRPGVICTHWSQVPSHAGSPITQQPAMKSFNANRHTATAPPAHL